ncbi:NHLP bacteriocin system secretion protein [Altericista sp. CCNU0014]|uniref:NHLP bacteriocin system secretion protein n=1 Tax=Altericista sp. CCNU0014 TaxID=3082949 RepID=UPI00384B0990
MADSSNPEGLFRKEALERLSSPEQLDQLMQIVKPRSWLMLASLGGLTVAALVWSVWGRLPVRVSAQAVLVYPYQIREIQSLGAGQLTQLNVAANSLVKQGQLLATIDRPELEKQIQQEQSKLVELQRQNTTIEDTEDRRDRFELESLVKQRQNLQQQIRNTERLLPQLQPITPTLRAKELESARQQQISLGSRLKDARRLDSVLKTRLDNRQRLFTEGALTQDAVLEAEQTYLNNLRSISELESQLSQVQVKLVQVERTAIEDRNRLLELQIQKADLQRKLQDLDTRATNIQQQKLQTDAQRTNALEDTRRSLNLLRVQMQQQREIRSPISGKVLELPVKVGQVVAVGTQLGLIATNARTQELQGLAFFPVQDGKKIRPGMAMQITPTTIKRERFGGIEATVASVTEFSITKQEMAALIGNADVVQSLGAGPFIGVYGKLQADPKTFTGYDWSSSKGPQLKLTPGTTATALVTLENRSPLSFVFPILREFTGLY